MKRLLALFLLLATPAFGQGIGSLQNHAIPIGKGPNVRGFTALAPGSVVNAPLLNTPNADPYWGSVPALNLAAGTGISINVVGTTATIAASGAVTGAITSLGGMSGPSITCGTAITCATNTISNGGVTSLGAATGAITLGSKLSIPGNVLTYTPDTPVCTTSAAAGLVGDGTTDNTTAFNTYLTSLSGASGCFEFGIGKYRFNSAITYTMANARQSIQIRGQSNDVSILYWPTGGGLKINQSNTLNSVHIHDMSITTGAVNTGTGLFLETASGLTGGFTGAQSELYNLQIRGDDYTDQIANSDYWGVAFRIHGWSNFNINGVNTYGLLGAPATAGGGTGFEFGGVGTNVSAIIYLSKCNFYFHSVGAQLDDFWEGVTIRDSNFQGETGVAGLLIPAGATHSGPSLNLFGNQFNTAGTQVDFLSAVNQVTMTGNTITTFGNSSTGATLGTSPGFVVSGNTFNLASGTSTLALAVNGANGIIGGNIFNGTATGVVLGASSTNVNISQNLYPGVTTQVSNLGTANSVGVATK